MPDNGSEPGCDLACQTKIIINGDNAANLISTTCEAIQHFVSNGGKLKHGDEVIARANSLEDDAVEFQKFVLREAIGYTGDVGHLLE